MQATDADRDDGPASGPGPESPGEPGYFHAVAIDYDGTLTDGNRPHPDTLAALAESRAESRLAILVTGRILAELRGVFPDVDDQFDLIVAENGAVLSRGGIDRAIAPTIPAELDVALAERGIAFRRGRVLLACAGADEVAVLAAVRQLGLECHLVRNRTELMVLPAGVSKGAGLFEGLGDLGISHHNTIAVGDAENDHSLLEVCELGVVVANAVDALKAHADVILDAADGEGVAALLRGPVIGGRQRVHPRRWQIDIGSRPDGTPVLIPASQLNVLVAGSPRRGKSYVAGLIAEQLIALGYSILVIDPEGDHTSLGRLRGVLVVGGDGPLPAPEQLAGLVSWRFGSLVVDLSAVSERERADYLRGAPAVIEAQRVRTGLPHWVIIEEAHEPLGRDGAARSLIEPAATGYCLVTYQPGDLCAEALLGVDLLIALPGGRDIERTVDLVAAAGTMSHTRARHLIASAGPGHGVLIDRNQPGIGLVFAIGQRGTGHLRHWHKYAAGRLPPERRFYFRSGWDTATGATAASIEELEHELRTCSENVICHHCAHEDFSPWIIEVLGDPPLGADVAAIEGTLRADETTPAAARDALVQGIRQRHPGVT